MSEYVGLLDVMADGLHAASPRLSLGVDLASWGILDRWPTYAASKVDFGTTMSSWYQGFGGNLSEAKARTRPLIAPGAFAPSRIHLGLSDQCEAPKYQNATCGWTQAELAGWVDFLLDEGIGGIDVWSPDHPENTPRWQWDQFKRLLAAPRTPTPSLVPLVRDLSE